MSIWILGQRSIVRLVVKAPSGQWNVGTLMRHTPPGSQVSNGRGALTVTAPSDTDTECSPSSRYRTLRPPPPTPRSRCTPVGSRCSPSPDLARSDVRVAHVEPRLRLQPHARRETDVGRRRQQRAVDLDARAGARAKVVLLSRERRAQRPAVAELAEVERAPAVRQRAAEGDQVGHRAVWVRKLPDAVDFGGDVLGTGGEGGGDQEREGERQGTEHGGNVNKCARERASSGRLAECGVDDRSIVGAFAFLVSCARRRYGSAVLSNMLATLDRLGPRSIA